MEEISKLQSEKKVKGVKTQASDGCSLVPGAFFALGLGLGMRLVMSVCAHNRITKLNWRSWRQRWSTNSRQILLWRNWNGRGWWVWLFHYLISLMCEIPRIFQSMLLLQVFVEKLKELEHALATKHSEVYYNACDWLFVVM